MTVSGQDLIALLDAKAVELSNDDSQSEFIRHLSLAWNFADWENKKSLYAAYWYVLEKLELIPKVRVNNNDF